jgi:FKBP-type peptidyl-prolyl cis-trans isomerase
MRALTDTLAGKSLIMTDEEVAATVKTFDAEQKQDLQHAVMMVAERNKKAGEAFFAENAKKEGVITLPSGLQYKMLKKGDGKIPTLDDVVACNYTGKLVDGTEIDSSYKRKEPTLVPVKGVIPGWTQALQLMPVGSKWEMYIPSQLAYGEKGTPAFGPNTTLIFQVELLSIKDKTPVADSSQPGPQPADKAGVADSGQAAGKAQTADKAAATEKPQLVHNGKP